MSEALGSWKFEGRVSLWRYRHAPKMYDGWHFTADPAGCASLIRLVELLLAACGPAHRTLPVTNPQTVGADRIFGAHALTIEVPAKLRLGNDLDASGSIGLANDAFVMPLGPQDLSNFSQAMRDISAGYADFGVGFGSSATIINFWWWSKTTA
jgi:hypothetical protein